MTINQDETHLTIDKIAKTRSGNGAFAYYESDDVYQEIWCMCMEAMDRYDPEIGPLENYLNRHVTNRLKNLKRDRYFRPGYDLSTSGNAKVKMNLTNALPLSDNAPDQGTVIGTILTIACPIETISCNETLEYICDHLPDRLLESFFDLINNNTVCNTILEEIRKSVNEILIQRDKDVGS